MSTNRFSNSAIVRNDTHVSIEYTIPIIAGSIPILVVSVSSINTFDAKPKNPTNIDNTIPAIRIIHPNILNIILAKGINVYFLSIYTSNTNSNFANYKVSNRCSQTNALIIATILYLAVLFQWYCAKQLVGKMSAISEFLPPEEVLR
jgi:hypothetical protein